MQSNGPLAYVALGLLALVALLLAVSVAQVEGLEERLVQQGRQLRALGEATERLTGQVERLSREGGAAPRGAAPRASGVDPRARLLHPEAPNLLEESDFRWPVPGAVPGGTLVRGWPQGDPSTLNPILASDAYFSGRIEAYAGSYLANRMVWTDLERFTGDLAWRVEVTEDFKVFTIYLRRGVRWHRPAGVDLDDPRYAWLDRDHEFTAHDLDFTFDMTLHPQVENGFIKGYYADIDSWEALDDYTFQVRWKRSLYGNVGLSIWVRPIPEFLFAYDEDGERFPEETIGLRFNQHWYNNRGYVGTGPYRMVSYEPGIQIRLERNEDYYGDKPSIREIVYPIYTDPNKTLLMLKAGELSTGILTPGQYREEIQRWEGAAEAERPRDSPFANGDIQCRNLLRFVFSYVGWNGDRPLFSDKRVRRAMTLALNREAIIANVYAGLGEVAMGPNHPTTPYNAPGLDPLTFDLDRAAALLAEAGWEDGDGDGLLDKDLSPGDGDPARTPFAFRLLIASSSPEVASLANIFKEDLLRIGVKMDIESAGFSLMLKRMDEREFDAYTGAWGRGYPPDPYQLWHSSQADVPKGSNYVGFRRPDADSLIEALRETFDPDERTRMLREVHRIIYDEQPYTFFRVRVSPFCWWRQVRGMVFSKYRPRANSLPWWIDETP